MPSSSRRFWRLIVGAVVGLAATIGAATTVAAADPESAKAQRLPASGTGIALSEIGWQAVAPTAGFVQREPEEGAAPSQPTEFRVTYDASTLYVRVRAFDSEPDKIITYLTRRDDNVPCDWLRVYIDSYHDRRTAYEFAVNPSGVKQDRYWFNDSNNDNSWDAVWDVSVSRDQTGWLAEFRIPFSQLRFAPGPSTTFGFSVVREIGRLKETSSWPLLPRSATGFVSSFGDLGGLTMLTAPKRLEVLPYTLSQSTRQRVDGNPLLKSSATTGALGLDLKYGLTTGLTLTGTMNPDFGQVEADPAVVNLSAFETFFNEQRPFFIEGSGNFNFDFNDGNLFYTRRIGRAPQGTDDLPSGDAVYTAPPAQTGIIGAAKITGRLGKYSIGALHAVTEEEHSSVADGVQRYDRLVEPLTNYSVARVRREFANQSSVGAMLTATNRQLAGDLRYLPKSAVAGGVDVDWRFKQRYSLTGYWAGSDVQGDREAIVRVTENSRHYFQRPGFSAADFDPGATSLSGAAGQLSVGKIGGERTRFRSSFAFKTPGFDISDLGFFRRADEQVMNNWFQVRSEKPSRWFRNRYLNFNQYARWNYNGDLLGSGANVNAHVNFANYWNAGGGFNINQRYFDDRLSRGGPGGLYEDTNGGWFYIDGDDRHRVTVNYNGSAWDDGHGSSSREYQPRVTIRPVPSVSFAGGVRIATSVTDAQWVNKVTDTRDHYVFAHLEQTTVSLTARASFTMKPTLSLQLYAEPFVSSGGYTAFKELVDGRNADYASRYRPFAYTGNPDFNYRSFRTTNVLRWEYRPGSTIFAVWQHAREGSIADGTFRFNRDFHDLFDVPGRNVFLLKVAYWLNY